MQLFRTPRYFQWIFPRRTWGFSMREKVVYLTFDDGPDPDITPWVLDVLKEHKVKACFFCVGQNIVNHPELFNRIQNEGHQVANHTFRHERGTKTKWSKYLQSIAETQEWMPGTLFRPPYGRIRFWQSFLLSWKYQIVMWTWLSYDYDKRVSIQEIMKQAERIRPGDILLLHDNQKVKERTKELLPKLLEYLKSKGYSFAAIPE